MTKDYNWRTDFNWQDKNDEPVKVLETKTLDN